MPPVVPFMGFGLVCFLTRLMPSISTRSNSDWVRNTVPRLPLSLPVMTTTSSPLRILFMVGSLQHFWRQRHDLHEALVAQFARDRPEDARADRLELGVQQDGGVAVELD